MTPAEQELYEERAAIIEYMGKVPRAQAEQQAAREIAGNHISPFQQSLISFSTPDQG